MNALILAVVLASQPTLFDAPRQSSQVRLLAQADLQPNADRAQLTTMRMEVSQRLAAASGPAPAVLAIVAIPNLISGGLFALGSLAFSSGSALWTTCVIVAVVRIGAAIAMWIASGVMASARADEREPLEAREEALDARQEQAAPRAASASTPL